MNGFGLPECAVIAIIALAFFGKYLPNWMTCVTPLDRVEHKLTQQDEHHDDAP